MNEIKHEKLLKDFEIEETTPLIFNYETRLKVVTYVPLEYADKLMFELGNAGAGIIGKYDLCSFRMKGLGTFRPLSGAKPFSGKEGKISFEEEIRFEMECGYDVIDNVIDSLLKHHPYEEVAYEIYRFEKRSKEPAILKVRLKKPVSLSKIILNIRNDISENPVKFDLNVQDILICDNIEIDSDLKVLAKKQKCKLIISAFGNKIIFKKI